MTKKLNLSISISFKKAALLLSSLFMINLVYGATITWDGSESTNWGNGDNWAGGNVPTINDDVIIPNVPNSADEPRISSGSSYSIKSLTINNNVTLTVNGTLIVTGNVSVNGDLDNNSVVQIGGNLAGSGTYTHKSTSSSYTKISGTLNLTSLSLSSVNTKGTFEFAGTNQVIPDQNFYKLTFSGTGSTLDSDISVSNVFTLNSGATLEIESGSTLTLTGSSAVINGTISGAGTLALNKSGSGTNNNLNISGEGSVSSNIVMSDEVTIVSGSTVNLGKFTLNASQKFTNNNILIYTAADAPTINGTLAGTGQIIIGTGVTYATVGDKGRFELSGTPSSILTSTTAYTNLYEYGSTTFTTIAGVNTGARLRTFTIGGTAPARLASGNARVAAGGRVFSLGSTPVPVTYVAFDGVLQGNSALISWATSMEYNNKEFIVEASSDAVNFTQVASVNGVGTTNSLSNYSVTVTNPLKYYRLKQVDFDGVSTYSKIIEVSGENINEFSVFPNPFVGSELYVNYNGSTEVDGVIVKIYDLNEKVHFEATLNFFGNEVSKLQLTEKLNKGIYFVSIQSQTGLKIQKLLVE